MQPYLSQIPVPDPCVRSGSDRGGRDFSGCDRELSPEQKEQAREGVSDHGEHHGELAGQLMTDRYDA